MTGERVRDHERRRRQVARPDQRVDPALEVPVARQHGHDREVVLVVTAFATSSGSGPEFPMHVVQPYPTSENPSLSRYGVSPAASR